MYTLPHGLVNWVLLAPGQDGAEGWTGPEVVHTPVNAAADAVADVPVVPVEDIVVFRLVSWILIGIWEGQRAVNSKANNSRSI